MKDLTIYLKNIPKSPGVYLMKDCRKKILYVGKAKNLNQRVKQYFSASGDGRYMIPFLISQVTDIETIVVPSEKDALILENNLIKKHKPKYNVFLKDDKSYIALRITTQHKWPKVDLVRYRGRPKAKALFFGPYTSAFSARATLDLLKRIYPLRQCSDQELARRSRPCILYDMKRCIAPCVGKCTKEEYDTYVDKTIQFLKGQNQEVIKDLQQEMQKASDSLEFEKAGKILETIKHIKKTIEKQHVDKLLGADADVYGIFRQGDDILLAQLIFRGGRLLGVHHYNFSNIAQDNEELLTTFLLQHYQSVEKCPKEILLPIAVSGSNSIAEILSEQTTYKVHIMTPKRGEKKTYISMAESNAEAAFKQAKDEDAIRERMLVELQEKLKLSNYPRRIECFDNSNLGGSEPVASKITFTDGKEDKQRYRKYKVKTASAYDDYGSMYEILSRRIKRGKDENDLPDLIIVDGGKGQLNVALKVLKELNIISVDVIGLAKEKGRHDRGMTLEQIYIPNVKEPIILRKHSPVLFLLQKIRDEAHRFAITFQRQRRIKKTLKSVLDEIPGIGPAKKKSLLKYFGSLKKVKEVTLSQLMEAPLISEKDAQNIITFFTGNNA